MYRLIAVTPRGTQDGLHGPLGRLFRQMLGAFTHVAILASEVAGIGDMQPGGERHAAALLPDRGALNRLCVHRPQQAQADQQAQEREQRLSRSLEESLSGLGGRGWLLKEAEQSQGLAIQDSQM